MKARLTLRMDEDLIRKAKAHAQRIGKPVSKIVEDYFAVLTAPPRRGSSEPTPRVRRLKGILRGADLGEESRRASECLDLLRPRSPVLLDGSFGEDLLEVLEEDSTEERPRGAADRLGTEPTGSRPLR